MNTNARGFSLIELMIVVAIIALLAAIALPAYREYTSRAKVINATAGLAGEKIKVTDNHNAGRIGAELCTGVASNGVACNDGTLSTGATGSAVDTSIRLQPNLGVAAGERIAWTCTVLASPTAGYVDDDCNDLTP